MSDETPLSRLTKLRQEIGSLNGIWNATALRHSTADAASVSTPGGSPPILEDLAAGYQKAERGIDDALMVISQIRGQQLPAVWAGETQVAASAAISAAERGLMRGVTVLGKIASGLRQLAGALEASTPRDGAGTHALHQAHGLTEEITVGFIPDPVNYDGDKMYRAHHLAMDGIAERIAAHTTVSDTTREVSSTFFDLASQARLARLSSSPLSPVDELLITDAGGTGTNVDNAILTAVMADRAADRFSRLDDADRARMEALLADAASTEHRAYLMRALAAGYDLNRITEFNQLIGPYGNDPGWLREHLSPMNTSGPASGTGLRPTVFDGAGWTQGAYPTCVASSTVAARAQVDPLYALELTTGGHPGDPRYDNGPAFAERLRDEQVRVHDGGRSWAQNLPIIGSDGMTNSQSATIADQEIGARTGADYHNRSINSADDRRAVLPSIERAVDEGHAVPFSTSQDGSGHQMLIVGHEGDMFQVYNPWGYTVWINESDFVNGRLDTIQEGIPRTPTSVRLPK